MIWVWFGRSLILLASRDSNLGVGGYQLTSTAKNKSQPIDFFIKFSIDRAIQYEDNIIFGVIEFNVVDNLGGRSGTESIRLRN